MNGKLISKTKYHYEKDTYKISEYDKVGFPTYETIIENKTNKVIEFLQYYNKELQSKRTYSYNQQGNLITENEYTYGKLNWKTFYSYDDKSRLLQKLNEKQGNTYSRIVWKEIYEYDNTGNWIKKVRFKNENPNTITERIIKYY